jgi:ribonucleotide reductase beta subunit family protein with ferritin-like domain
MAAPTWDVQLLLATQVADEHRHMQAVLRIYEEVFGVRGGIDEVRKVADRNMDMVAEALYARLEHHVGRLEGSTDEDDFVRAVVVYHLLAEGVIARTAQNLAATQYERLSFPGLAEGQRLVARDEARHIGIGVSYVRRRMEQAPERTTAVITGLMEELLQLWSDLLSPVEADADLGELVRSGYGIEPVEFYMEALRLVQVRLSSVGYEGTFGD